MRFMNTRRTTSRPSQRWLALFGWLALILLSACNLDVPPVTPTVAPTRTPTATPAFTATATDTRTPTRTHTATITPSPTATHTATETFTATATDTPIPSATLTFTFTPSDTFTPTETQTYTPTPTYSSTPTDTLTPTFTVTPSPTLTPSETYTPSATFTGTFTATFTPSETPTPTETPTATATSTDTATATATLTPTDTLTSTETPTDKPSVTPTDTPSPTETPTETLTPSATFTLTPTVTFTPSATNTDTPMPSPTLLPTIGPTATFTESPTPTETPTVFVAAVLPTNTPDVFPTMTFISAALTLTSFAQPTATLFVTPEPPTDLPTLAVPTDFPTLDATPTFFTATPGGDVLIIPSLTLPFDEATPDFGEATPTSIPSVPTLAPTALTLQFVVPTAPPEFASFDFSTRSFALTTGALGVDGVGFALPGGAVRFSVNPATGAYARVDRSGSLFISPNAFDGGSRLSTSPFSEFAPSSPEENNAAVGQVAWSPDGRYLAFTVDTESDGSSNNDSANDGVWLYNPAGGAAVQLVHDCPPEPGCGLVDPGGEPWRLRTVGFEWNFSSTAILVSVFLPDENRAAFQIVEPTGDPNYASTRRQTYRYDYATWGLNNTAIGSGASSTGRVGIFRITPGSPEETVLYDAAINGLWVQNAIESLNGELFMLGSTGGRGSAQSLYVVRGGGAIALTGALGNSPPVRVDWSPDRRAVLVVTQEGGQLRYFVARTNGTSLEITPQVANALAVEWVTGNLPPSVDAIATAPPASIDTGEGNDGAFAPIGAIFEPGQSVRVIFPEGLNLRDQPGLGSNIAGFVPYNLVGTVISGPTTQDGITWWQVQFPDLPVGWIAQQVGEVPGLTSV